MFSGAALGLACHTAVPALHPLVAVVAAMSAATVVVLRQPIAVILIMVVMIQIQFVAVVTLATLIGYLLTRPLSPKAEPA
jgi:H+/Cl- antiporter ClcA